MTSSRFGGKITRRGFLAGSAAVTAGSLAACSATDRPAAQAGDGQGEATSVDQHEFLTTATVDFDGLHQAGISTPHQAHLNLVGFTLNEGLDRADIRRLMTMWTTDSRMLSQGKNPPGSLEPEMVTVPANLTITCGFGPRVFEVIGAVDKKPAWLKPLPAFNLDQLDPQWEQADLVLQICADDPTTASYVMRHLIRIAPTYVKPQWLQQGFLNAHGGSDGSPTPRNLFGQLDGSANPQSDEDINKVVFIDDGPSWQRGSAAMVVRRVRMNLDTWEELDRTSRENAVGRRLSDGAPLSGGDEFDDINTDVLDEYGLPVVDLNSHAARAQAPADHPEQKMLRRGYNYDLPVEIPSPDGQLSNAGQIFIAFVKDPTVQFIPVQERLDERDLLNTWITHIGSGVYWLPPGTHDGGDSFWAEGLLNS